MSIGIKGSKEFYEELQEGDEYAIVTMMVNDYHSLPDNIKGKSTVKVLQKSCLFDQDEIHCQLVKEISKANKKLRDYEYNKNNK
tara:strand:+ start:138 stop:389 length:252 start_codon:yes stop_codon:yes gene_type:complete